MEQARNALNERPVPKTVSKMSLMAPSLQKAAACPVCKATAFAELELFAEGVFADRDGHFSGLSPKFYHV
jgi:hypothetical protein